MSAHMLSSALTIYVINSCNFVSRPQLEIKETYAQLNSEGFFFLIDRRWTGHVLGTTNIATYSCIIYVNVCHYFLVFSFIPLQCVDEDYHML